MKQLNNQQGIYTTLFCLVTMLRNEERFKELPTYDPEEIIDFRDGIGGFGISAGSRLEDFIALFECYLRLNKIDAYKFKVLGAYNKKDTISNLKSFYKLSK